MEFASKFRKEKSSVLYMQELKQAIRIQNALREAYESKEESFLERTINGKYELVEIFSTTTYHTTDENNKLRSYSSLEELEQDGWTVKKVS